MSKIEKKKQLENVEFYTEELEKDNIDAEVENQANKSNTIKDYDKDIINILPEINSDEDERPLLNENDLVNIIDTSHKNKNKDNTKPISSLIKKDDKKAKEVFEPNEFKNKFSKSNKMTKEDWSEIASDLENSESLNDKFLDFVELPKISGDKVNFIGRRLISSEYVKSDKKTVEISDNISDDDLKNHSSSIEINRTENGDIESITVYCKCGEITNIRFDYEENSAQSTGSEYVQSINDVEPLNLPNIETK